MRTLLEFEKPIAELEDKLIEMRKLALENNVDVTAAVASLTDKILELKKETFANLTRWQRVQLSRHPDRPYTFDYIEKICTEFIEIHGDRSVADDKAMVGGFGNIDDEFSVMFIGQQKGRNTKQRQLRNFGMPNPEGYRKALRLYRMAEKFGLPIITLIDTPGAYPGIGAEERGQSEAIARNLYVMAELKTPIIGVIIGEGYNQVKGVNLYGKFKDKTLDNVDIIKNTEVIYYMRNDKQELIGINKSVCSKINLKLDKNKIDDLTLFDKPDSDIYPEKELPENARKLRGFIWRGDERIKSIDDLFTKEENEMNDKIVKASKALKAKADVPMKVRKETLEYKDK